MRNVHSAIEPGRPFETNFTAGQPGRHGSRRVGLAGALGVNILIICILLWSSTETMPVSVTIANGLVTGVVGGAAVQAPAPKGWNGDIGLFLQGADPRTTIYWGSQPPKSVGSLIRSAFYRTAAESAWADLTTSEIGPGGSSVGRRVLDQSRFTTVFGDWFRHPFGGQSSAVPSLLLASTSSMTNVRVDATLLRPRNPAGIFISTTDSSNGLLFYFRPENRDVMWYEVRDGQWFGPVASAPYRQFSKDGVSGAQDVLRLLFGGYPFAILLIAVVLIAVWIDRRSQLSEPDLAPSSFPGGHVQAAQGINWLRSLAVPVAMSALVALSLASAIFVASNLLERMPHVQDSVAYLFQAKTFALGRLWVPTPIHPDFFRHEFIVMDGVGRWFSKYPPGWPALLAVGVVAGVPWLVDPVCAAISVFLTYRIGAEIYRPRVGLIAAALYVVAPFVMFLSGSMMSHTSGLLFTLLMTWSIWRTSRSNRPVGFALLGGASFGTLFLIRPYTGLVIAVPIALYALSFARRHGVWWMQRWIPTVAAALPFVAAFLLYNKVFTDNYLYPPQQLWWAFDKVGFGPDNGPWGYTPVDALNNTSRNLSELLEHAFGWPQFATLAFLLLPFLVGRVRTWDWVFLGGFLALVLGYAAWWADGIMYGPRFYFEAFGFVIILTARGVDVLLDLGRSRPFASLVAYVSVVLLVIFNVEYYLPGQLRLYQGYNYVNASKVDAIEAKKIHNAVVFADVGDNYQWWEYGMVFSANDPLLQGDVIYARDLGDAQDKILSRDFPGRTYWRLTGSSVSPLDLASVYPSG